MSKPPEKPKPVIYLIGGCNGAGKTTFAREFLPSTGVLRFLNADEIARGLSPLQPGALAFRAGRLLLEEVRSLVEKRESFALESTLSGRTYVTLLKRAKEAGYDVRIHYVWIPNPQTAIQRVQQRVRQGGHHVPPEDVHRRFQRSARHFVEDYAPLAHHWALWDNTTPPAILLAESPRHSIVQLGDFLSAHD